MTKYNQIKMFKKLANDFCGLAYMAKHFYDCNKLFFILHFTIVVVTIPVMSLLNIFMQMSVVDRIVEGDSWVAVLVMIIALHCAYLAINMLQQTFSVYSTPIHMEVVEKLDKMVFEKAIHSDLINFNNPKYYDDYSWTIGNFSNQSNVAKSVLIDFSTHVISIVSIGAIIFTLDHLLLVFVLLHVVVSFVMKRFRIAHEYKMNLDLINSARILEYVKRIFYDPQNTVELKCNKSSQFLMAKYSTASKNRKATRSKYTNKFLFFVGTSTLNIVSFNFIIMSYLVYQTINVNLSIGSFVAMTTASITLSGMLGSVTEVFNKAHEISLYAKKVKDFMTAKSNIESSSEKDQKYVMLNKNDFTIEIKNLGFRYNTNEDCLHDINMTINKGEKIAIVGENGAGKSTVVKLLLRLYDVDEGEILVNGKKIQLYDVKELRCKIGTAFQKQLIYALTLSENIQLYAVASNDEMVSALKKVGLNRLVDGETNYLNTEMTKEFCDDGIVLSGGGEQKLALSRLFIGDFKLLILDEPSNMLDPLAEYELNNSILNLNNDVATVIISHRLSNIKNVDKIYVLGGGTIRESGTHHELMKLNGVYAEMFNKQADGYT